jgi:hypothetical protein
LNNSAQRRGLSSAYDGFLYAAVAEDADGMPLSVVSALARANMDPWIEAARLSSMPIGAAETSLAETLHLDAQRNAGTVAAQLISHLPRKSGGLATAIAAKDGGLRTACWWVLLAIAIAISALSPYRPESAAAPSNGAGGSHAAARSDVPVPLKSAPDSP